MKSKIKIIFPVIVLLSAFAFKAADDIITRLGMQQAEAKKYIFGNMLGGFEIPTVKLLPDIIKGDKAGAAKELCAYVKMYCNSEDFINDYNQHRNLFKPKNEPPRDANVTKANADLVKMYKEGITTYEKYLADAKKKKDAGSIAIYEKELTNLRKQVAELEDPTPNKTAWEKKYPVKPDAFVKARLEEYLSLVATVDFSAKLTPRADGKRMVFVNPAYENKSRQWKAIYRAGKEVNDVVTAFVKEWLKGEIISSAKTKMPDDTVESTEDKTQAAKPSNETQKTAVIIDSTIKKRKVGSGIRNKVNGKIGKIF